MTKLFMAALAGALTLFAAEIPQEAREAIDKAVPQKAAARAKKHRKLLIMNLHVVDGKRVQGHASIPYADYAFEKMGQVTGAYETVFSDDVAMFAPEKVRQFDAVCFLNTAGVLTEDKGLRQSLLDFVGGGKGWIGVHAGGGATFVQYPKYDQFPEFGEMIGGYENGGHPWKPQEKIYIKVDDPRSPVAAAFGGKNFETADEVFQFQAPWSREKVHVLVSIDADKTDLDPKRHFLPERMKDKDFALSWIRNYGKGRIFLTSFGHNIEIYENPAMLAHFLAGIQFALGDLKADATPSAGASR